MVSHNGARPVPLIGNRPLEDCRLGRRANHLGTNPPAKSSARKEAERLFAAIWRPFKVVVQRRRAL